MPAHFDVLIENGRVFDGMGNPSRAANVGIRDGRVVRISDEAIPHEAADEVLDADGLWVMPGFIDFHTHYDVEVEVAPSLSESLRHGVTVVSLGSCSLGASLGTPEDIADIFCRVEAVPRPIVLPLLEQIKDWNSLPGYFDHLETLPLGPHITSFVGHSNIRMHTMGFDRSVDPKLRPSRDEVAAMQRLLEEGLDAGYMGVSIQTLPWDKLDGTRFRSRPLPSYFAKWREYRQLTRICRRRGRVFQGVPNITTKVNVLLFLLESAGLFRRPLRTSIISLMDIRADRSIYWVVPIFTRLFNRFLRADFRMQSLPNLFDLWSDGIDLVVFEEFGAGTEALHLIDPDRRAELLRDPDYRERFKKDWRKFFSPKVYHRNFKYTEVLACPDERYVGRSFAEIGADEERDAVDVFLDLVAEHRDALRWYSVMANDRQGPLEWIANHPDVLIGFSDAGAHLRQMAHYNYPLRLLKLARDAEQRGEPFMSMERAVYRVTGEPAEWFGMDAGVLAEGRRADVVVVDPTRLDESLDEAHEAEMTGFGGHIRLVRRNPDTVRAVYVSGKKAVANGEVLPAVGQEKGFGTVLRSVDRSS
jgi:N-acyl-D-aspartate/D-glutamate deacylase